MKIRYIIKCDIERLLYIYWNGVTWSSRMDNAMFMETESEAVKELKTLSPPRLKVMKGPHVFEV